MEFFKKHKKLFLLVLVITGILIFFLYPKPKKPIATAEVKRGSIVQTISVNGAIAAQKSVDLIFPIAGKVTYIGVKKGDVVNAYQTIAILDQRTVQKNLEQALLDYSKQRNTFEQTKDNYKNTVTTDALKRILENNQYDLDKSVKSVELQDLVKQQSILSTPISGIITRADVLSAGVTVTSATTFTVVDPTSLVFDMDVDQADIGKIKVGQSVDIVLDTYPDQTLHLLVNSIDFVTHATSTGGSAYTVETQLPKNHTDKYRVGMNGTAEIILEKKENVLTVPISSIFDNNKVSLKTKNGFVKKQITVGLQNDVDVEISGLSKGDIVEEQPAVATP